MKNVIINISIFLFGVILLMSVIFGGWFFKRTVNYKLCYQDSVQKEVQKAIQEHEKLYHKN